MKDFGKSLEILLYQWLTKEKKFEYSKLKMREYCDKFFKQVGIKPIFESESEQRFVSNRDRLNSKGGGLIIANHPECGRADTYSILHATDRKDVHMLAHPDWMKRQQNTFPDDFILPIASDFGFEEIIKILNQAIKLIKDGKLVIVYPTMGIEDIRNIKFRKGMAYILERLDDDTMVYSFFFNPQDAQRICIKKRQEKFKRGIRMLTGAVVPEKDELILRIRENCSNVQDWPKPSKNETGNIMNMNEYLDFYCQQFGINISDLSKK